MKANVPEPAKMTLAPNKNKASSQTTSYGAVLQSFEWTMPPYLAVYMWRRTA